MKKLMFSFIAIASITFMSFKGYNANSNPNEFKSFEIELINNNKFSDTDVDCRWRTCSIYSDGSKSCGEWTYGKCTKDGTGKLTPITVMTED